eukprot:9488030-Pyramimonas_sp.AAC.1
MRLETSSVVQLTRWASGRAPSAHVGRAPGAGRVVIGISWPRKVPRSACFLARTSDSASMHGLPSMPTAVTDAAVGLGAIRPVIL